MAEWATKQSTVQKIHSHIFRIETNMKIKCHKIPPNKAQTPFYYFIIMETFRNIFRKRDTQNYPVGGVLCVDLLTLKTLNTIFFYGIQSWIHRIWVWAYVSQSPHSTLHTLVHFALYSLSKHFLNLAHALFTLLLVTIPSLEHGIHIIVIDIHGRRWRYDSIH